MGRNEDLKPRKCKYAKCGITYQPKVWWQQYHSRECQWRAWDERNPRVPRGQAHDDGKH